MTSRRLSIRAALSVLALGSVLDICAATVGLHATLKSTQALNYSVLPSDAEFHCRTKWSGNVFLYVDDEYYAPIVFVFDRTGKLAFSSEMHMPATEHTRLDDFDAGPDGSVWASGHSSSATGQESFFLAHLTSGTEVRLVALTSYRALHLTVAPDGSVWTVGRPLNRDATGEQHTIRTADVLRHFDTSGNLIGSTIPFNTLANPNRALQGYLVSGKDRIGWYSPVVGPGEYVELSLEGKILHSYPSQQIGSGSVPDQLMLTPSGRALVWMGEGEAGGPRHTVLYELDREHELWSPVELAYEDIWPQGSDGESLVFLGGDHKTLHFLEVSQPTTGL